MQTIYLDYAATTFIKDEVLDKMMPYLKEEYGNASAVYKSGRRAKEAVEKARQCIAQTLGAGKKDSVIFTSGGTESNNWALFGAVRHLGVRYIVTTSVEHHSVLEACAALEGEGCAVTYLPVDGNGQVSAAQVADAVDEGVPTLVSVMYANNEVGVINPIADIARAAKGRNAFFHTDAVAAAGHVGLELDDVDMLSLSAHKFYGPKGVGVLFVKDGVRLKPMLYGGKQEKNLRAGTENVAGIVGAAAAMDIAYQTMDDENARLAVLREDVEARILQEIEGSVINGSGAGRLANYINVSLPYINASSALISLDLAGIECAAGSACNTGSVGTSHVLLAMGPDEAAAKRSIRLTLGASTTKAQLDYTIEHLKQICAGAASLQMRGVHI